MKGWRRIFILAAAFWATCALSLGMVMYAPSYGYFEGMQDARFDEEFQRPNGIRYDDFLSAPEEDIARQQACRRALAPEDRDSMEKIGHVA